MPMGSGLFVYMESEKCQGTPGAYVCLRILRETWEAWMANPGLARGEWRDNK